MRPSVSPSLFPERERIEGSEIKFRAVCALGWQLYQRLSELRSICEDHNGSAHLWTHWIDEINKLVLSDFEPSARNAETWPAHIEEKLQLMAKRPEVECFPLIAGFLKEIASEVTSPKALNPVSQFDHFNHCGFNLAVQMINDPNWSTDLVRDRWKDNQAHPWHFRENSEGSFYPVTRMEKDKIEILVNAAGFDTKNALLFYLTLEFQMMHEYISHFLPVWNSGYELEERYLLAVMFLFYRAERRPNDGIHVLLVHMADDRRADVHRTRRTIIQDQLAPIVQERRLSQLLLELAVLQEHEMQAADKRRLLAMLNRIPVRESQQQTSIEIWLREDDLATIYRKLSTVFEPPRKC